MPLITAKRVGMSLAAILCASVLLRAADPVSRVADAVERREENPELHSLRSIGHGVRYPMCCVCPFVARG